MQAECPVKIKGEVGYNDKAHRVDDDVLYIERHRIGGIGQQPVGYIEAKQEQQQDDVPEPCPVVWALEVERSLCTQYNEFDDDRSQCDRVHLCTSYHPRRSLCFSSSSCMMRSSR